MKDHACGLWMAVLSVPISLSLLLLNLSLLVCRSIYIYLFANIDIPSHGAIVNVFKFVNVIYIYFCLSSVVVFACCKFTI